MEPGNLNSFVDGIPQKGRPKVSLKQQLINFENINENQGMGSVPQKKMDSQNTNEETNMENLYNILFAKDTVQLSEGLFIDENDRPINIDFEVSNDGSLKYGEKYPNILEKDAKKNLEHSSNLKGEERMTGEKYNGNMYFESEEERVKRNSSPRDDGSIINENRKPFMDLGGIPKNKDEHVIWEDKDKDNINSKYTNLLNDILDPSIGIEDIMKKNRKIQNEYGDTAPCIAENKEANTEEKTTPHSTIYGCLREDSSTPSEVYKTDVYENIFEERDNIDRKIYNEINTGKEDKPMDNEIYVDKRAETPMNNEKYIQMNNKRSFISEDVINYFNKEKENNVLNTMRNPDVSQRYENNEYYGDPRHNYEKAKAYEEGNDIRGFYGDESVYMNKNREYNMKNESDEMKYRRQYDHITEREKIILKNIENTEKASRNGHMFHQGPQPVDMKHEKNIRNIHGRDTGMPPRYREMVDDGVNERIMRNMRMYNMQKEESMNNNSIGAMASNINNIRKSQKTRINSDAPVDYRINELYRKNIPMDFGNMEEGRPNLGGEYGDLQRREMMNQAYMRYSQGEQYPRYRPANIYGGYDQYLKAEDINHNGYEGYNGLQNSHLYRSPQIMNNFMVPPSYSMRKKRRTQGNYHGNPLIWAALGQNPEMMSQEPGRGNERIYGDGGIFVNSPLVASNEKFPDQNEIYSALPMFLNIPIEKIDGKHESVFRSFQKEYNKIDIRNVTVFQLKLLIKKYGLNFTGKKTDLIRSLEMIYGKIKSIFDKLDASRKKTSISKENEDQDISYDTMFF